MHRWLSVVPMVLALPVAAQQAAPGGLSLAPARHLAYTASRGTWMSLDVSPDGRTIVFDLLGDLYTLPIGGGRATRLTTGMAIDVQPRFSPDGRRIAFVSDRSGGDNVWTIAATGGEPVQVSKGEDWYHFSPEWTPDGRQLIVSRALLAGGAPKLWLYDVDGGTGLQLGTPPAPLGYWGAAFGPDGRYVYYAVRNGIWNYNAIFPQFQVGVFDRLAGTYTQLTSRVGSAFRPAISPDGRWMVYGTRQDTETGLRLRDMASGQERWLAYPVQRDNQEAVPDLDVLPGYSFTPDAQAVVVSYGGEIWRVPVDGAAPAKIPFTADVDVAIGPEVKFEYPVSDAPTFTARQIRDPVPSPDGRRLAFSALDRVWVMDLPTGTPRRVSTGTAGEFYPAWSPDGQWLAYTTWSDSGGHIFKVRPDGTSRPYQVTRRAGYFNQLVWSPTGTRLVAVRADPAVAREATNAFTILGLDAQLVWYPSAEGAAADGQPGSDATVISPAADRGNPHFTADTSRIYAYGGQGLVSFRWDGTDQRVHLIVRGNVPNGVGVSGGPGWQTSDLPQPSVKQEAREAGIPGPPADVARMSPDGTRALVMANRQVWMVPVAQIGSAPPNISLLHPDSAAVPVRRLTELAGEFAGWSADGRRAHWAIGNAFVTWDLAAAAAAGASYRPSELRVALQVPRDTPRGAVVLRGGRVITMRGDEVLENADVVIRDNRIVGVGARGQVPVPSGARVIDVRGSTIMPGLVDTHAHIDIAWLVHWQQSFAMAANLAYGVTTVRDPQTGTTDVLTYSDRVDAGSMIGPRFYATGPGVFNWERVGSLDDARHILRRYAEYFDTKTIKMYETGNRQQRQWIIAAARELRLMPTTEGGLEFKKNLSHALDGYSGIEHAIPITPMYDDMARLLATSGTVNTPTVLVSYGGPWAENWYYNTEDVLGDQKLRRWMPPDEVDGKARRRGFGGSTGTPGFAGWFRRDEHVFPRHAAWIRDLVAAGGRAGVGSHGQLQGLGYHWELWSMQSGGLSTHDALRAATRFGAEALGLGRDLGSIEAGKLADLIVLSQNPLENIRNTTSLRYVMKNGRLYDATSLAEVWPRRGAPLRLPWQSAPVPSSATAGQ